MLPRAKDLLDAFDFARGRFALDPPEGLPISLRYTFPFEIRTELTLMANRSATPPGYPCTV